MTTPPPETLRALVGEYLHTQCTVILEAATPLRSGENVIHRTRVAVRRLRSTTRVFGELFELPRAGRLDEELRWWAGVLGAVRDLDVMELRLEARLAGLPPDLVLGPVRVQLGEVVAVRRQQAVAALQETLDGERYGDLVALLRAWQTDPPFTGEADRPAARAARYVKRADHQVDHRLAAGVRAARRGDPAAETLLHRARKAGKRHRYAAEAVEPVWGGRASKVVARRKDLQELLGDHQDSAVTMEFLRELGALSGAGTGHNGFTWGVLHGQEQAERDQLVRRLKPFL